MKVLLLHQHFNTPYSGGAIRSYYLAKALVDHGISTFVITAYDGKNYKTENVDGIEVHYLPIPYNNSYGFYKRSWAFIRYVLGVIKLSEKFRNSDWCYAMSVPLTVGLAAMTIRKRYKIPFIFEVGDLWPDAPIQMGFIKNVLFKKSLYRLEKSIYKRAHSIVALSPEIQAVVNQRASQKNVHFIPNMSDTFFFKPEEKNETLLKKYNLENKFIVSYIGAIGFANGLEHFLECAKASQEEALHLHFILCGEGALLPTIVNASKELKLQNFTIIPFQNREGVKEIMNVTDASFISYKQVPILETGSPNKYFDGLAAGKLIIVNFGGWIRNEIEKNKCGVFVDPNFPEDFIAKLKPFLNSRELLKAFQQSARKLAENSYSRKLLSERFVALFE